MQALGTLDRRGPHQHGAAGLADLRDLADHGLQLDLLVQVDDVREVDALKEAACSVRCIVHRDLCVAVARVDAPERHVLDIAEPRLALFQGSGSGAVGDVGG